MADPYIERRAQMFPSLDAEQLARLSACGTRHRVRRGELLFEQGEVRTRFFVVLEGAVEVLHPDGEREELVTVLLPGQFTGETDMLSGRRSLLRGRMREDGELLELDREALRRLVQTDAELSELIMRAFILRRVFLIAHAQGDALLLGSRHSAGTLLLKEFLTRNGHPYVYVDVETDADVQALLDRFHVRVEDVPVVVCRSEHVLRNPSPQQVAACLGLVPRLDEAAVRTLVVVGAGPAGLAAAVYGASEGLDTLVLETTGPGGQAGSSSKIENYLGFPTGISGQALAGRAYTQAEKFGAEVAVAVRAVRLQREATTYLVGLEDGGRVRARSLILATGAEYRKLTLPERERFEGVGIYYGATYLEAQLCGGEEIIVVGGGNSAGQAAVFLSRIARRVHMLVRSGGLAASMSRYLIRRIEESPAITLHTHTQLAGLVGDDHLERVRWRNSETGSEEARPIRHVFCMTGASPNTGWLPDCVALDDKGFIKTGQDLTREELARARWPLARSPHLLETSLPGVFAVGDVRSGSVKRLASAVGEGSICVQLVHRALAD
ncbi:MAG: FAD-dependent oxidoreductase [Myxococcaceae bacterium]|nr:FAD-dependent oxidoreductase [Myxococcaceae bacterium]MCI0669794.1 FAD-dependent oxidoreductase [Myxococcaceae bacterium]